MRKLLFLSLFCLVELGIAERIFPCPNNGKPKLTNLGKPIQCLPGQDNELVCGRGYICFFSGFNYQCCPSAKSDEEKESNEAEPECPSGALTVLDSNGQTLECGPSETCPQDNMYCAHVGRKAICCESLTPGSYLPTRSSEKNVQHGSKTFATDFKAGKGIDPSDLECPAPSLTVLGDDGQPIVCATTSDCPQETMNCHYAEKFGICCENLAAVKDLKNPLKYRPKESSNSQTEFDLEKEIDQAIVTQRPRSNVLSKPNKFADSEYAKQNVEPEYDYSEIGQVEPSSTTESHPTPNSRKPKNRRRNLALAAQLTQPDTKTNEEPLMEYKPHASGGYAVKKIKNNRKLPPEARLLAQQYLLEQIKNGWPYDEKFYRSPNDTR